jgi:GTP cyclohydrolase FolE2
MWCMKRTSDYLGREVQVGASGTALSTLVTISRPRLSCTAPQSLVNIYNDTDTVCLRGIATMAHAQRTGQRGFVTMAHSQRTGQHEELMHCVKATACSCISQEIKGPST